MTNNDTDFLSRSVVGGWRTMLPLAVAVLLFGSSVLLLSHDLNTLPRVPMPNEGRTYPLQEHRAIVYGTLGETALFYGVLIAGFAIGAVGIGNEKRMRERIDTKKELS